MPYPSPRPGGVAPRVIKAFSGNLGGLEWTRDNKKLIFSHGPNGAQNTLSELTIVDGSVQDLPFGRHAGSLALDARGDRMAFTVRIRAATTTFGAETCCIPRLHRSN